MTDQAQNLPDTPKDLYTPSKFAPKGIPLEAIIEHRRKGLSYRDIGKLLNCSHGNISDRLKQCEGMIDHVDAIKKNQSDMLHIKKAQLLNSLTVSQIKEMSPAQKVVAYGILYDKSRLEDDKSTGNIDVNSQITVYKSNQIEKDRLLSMMQELEADSTQEVEVAEPSLYIKEEE